jgi:hypothetical protein
MEKYLHSKLSPLYKTYNEVIKPLIADIEIFYEKFPLPIFNEIRAYNDHISRCFTLPLSESDIDNQSNKAKVHIERIVLDCYKFLNVKFHENIIGKFEKRIKYISISNIDSGRFEPKYIQLRNEITKKLKKAKKLERINKENSIRLYGFVYEKYDELDNLIIDNRQQINWAIAKFTTKKIMRILGWLFAAIISGIVSSQIVPYDLFINWFLSLFP